MGSGLERLKIRELPSSRDFVPSELCDWLAVRPQAAASTVLGLQYNNTEKENV